MFTDTQLFSFFFMGSQEGQSGRGDGSFGQELNTSSSSWREKGVQRARVRKTRDSTDLPVAICSNLLHRILVRSHRFNYRTPRTASSLTAFAYSRQRVKKRKKWVYILLKVRPLAFSNVLPSYRKCADDPHEQEKPSVL